MKIFRKNLKSQKPDLCDAVVSSFELTQHGYDYDCSCQFRCQGKGWVWIYQQTRVERITHQEMVRKEC
jgi:hypothetical protein